MIQYLQYTAHIHLSWHIFTHCSIQLPPTTEIHMPKYKFASQGADRTLTTHSPLMGHLHRKMMENE